jgi:hypothetical protein
MKCRFIRGYSNYIINEIGQIKNLKTSKVINGSKNAQGYLRVTLSSGKNRRDFSVHRLVASTFCSNPDKHQEVHHKDHDRNNNHRKNLKWVSREENMHYVHNKYIPWVNNQEARPISNWQRIPRKLKKKLKNYEF